MSLVVGRLWPHAWAGSPGALDADWPTNRSSAVHEQEGNGPVGPVGPVLSEGETRGEAHADCIRAAASHSSRPSIGIR